MVTHSAPTPVSSRLEYHPLKLAVGRGQPVDLSGRMVQPSLLVNDVGVAVSPWGSRSFSGVSRGYAQLFSWVTHSAPTTVSSRLEYQRLKLAVGRGQPVDSSGRVVQPGLLVNDVGVAVESVGKSKFLGRVTGWFAALFVVTHSAPTTVSSGVACRLCS